MVLLQQNTKTMKNALIRRQYDMFEMIEAFKVKRGAAFAVGSRGATLFAANSANVTAMRGAGAGQLSGSGEYHGGTSSKRFWYGELKEDLTAIRDTAVSIAEAEDTPDFDDSFRMPRGSGYGVMATAARSFLADAAPHQALFVEFELPANFLTDLAGDLAEFEKAEDKQDDGLLGQVGGTANLAALSIQGMKIRKQLQAIVRNKFKASPAVLAEWETAQHIASAPGPVLPVTPTP